MPFRVVAAALWLFAVWALSACSKSETATVADNRPLAYVDATGAPTDTSINKFPHLQMVDGQVTLNDRCPVRKSRLNLRLAAMHVNGMPVGFC